MHFYASLFMIMLYTFIIIGGGMCLVYVMHIVSPLLHGYITTRMHNQRAMDKAVVQYINTYNKEGK